MPLKLNNYQPRPPSAKIYLTISHLQNGFLDHVIVMIGWFHGCGRSPRDPARTQWRTPTDSVFSAPILVRVPDLLARLDPSPTSALHNHCRRTQNPLLAPPATTSARRIMNMRQPNTSPPLSLNFAKDP